MSKSVFGWVLVLMVTVGVASPAVAQPAECDTCSTDSTTVGQVEGGFGLVEDGAVGDSGQDSTQTGQPVGYAGPSYWTHDVGSSATQSSCVRPQWNAGAALANGTTYENRDDAVTASTSRFPAWIGDTGDEWRPGDFIPACVIEPGEEGPEPPSPLEIAMSAWYSSAVTVAPSITVEPEAHDYTLVGLPTIIAIDDYNPGVDIDSDPRTITWSFGSIELRATAQHKFSWDDGGAGDTEWVSSNGRGYIEGDETGVYADPQPFAHVYEVAGERAVQVEVRWSGEWRNAGGVWEPLPVGPIFQSLTETVDVQQRQAVITG